MKFSPTYTISYAADTIRGEHGYSYRCFCDGKLCFEGWSRGPKREAEAEVRRGIDARETMMSFVPRMEAS